MGLSNAPPGLVDALEYPFFQTVFDRKSRRVGLGMTVGSEVLQYARPYAPVPLSELEEALLCVAGTGLTGTDRMLGLFFGLARGGVIVVAMVMLGGLTPFPRDDWWQRSRALPAFEEMADKATQYLPEALRDNIDFSPGGEVAPEAPDPDGEGTT